MKNKKLLFVLFCICNSLFAVINTFEDSYSVKHNINTPFTSISMEEIDVDALLLEDEQNRGMGVPMRYAHAFDVNFGIENAGTWEELEDGSKIWRIGIHSTGAYGMKFLFDSYWLPEGGKLYVYSSNLDMSIGPYTNAQNHEDGTFGTPLVNSDHIVVEYYQPENVEAIPQLNLDKIYHAYRDIHDYYGQQEDSNRCNNNVACSEANPYEDQVNSVIYLEMYQYICSAALINNTAQDLTPYVLTAQHCVDGEASVGQHNNFTFYFNHQSSSCSGSSGNYGQSETGSYLRAEDSSSDFALLEMDDEPSFWWDPFYAGWSRYTSAPTISVGIHHPGGQPKKINYDNDTAGSSGSDWTISWDNGGTTGGSSGSPAFDSNLRVIGQLYGGNVDCGGTDWYGKFSSSWSGSSSSSRLKDWLDPGNTSAYTLDGTYDGASIVYGCTDSNACNYNSDATNDDESCEYAQGSCNCNGNPTGNYCDCNYNVDDECGVCDGDGSSCAGSVILSFGNVDENTGTAEIFMQNDVDIAGFQFIITDYPDVLDLSNISSGMSAEYGFTVSNSENGAIVGFTLTGTSIPAGIGILLIATFDTNTNTETNLCLSDAIFSDTNANGIPVNLGSCIDVDFNNSLYGDLDGDGVVNVIDAVILVNAVLNGENISGGDLNSDGIVNILDIVILVNLILGG